MLTNTKSLNTQENAEMVLQNLPIEPDLLKEAELKEVDNLVIPIIDEQNESSSSEEAGDKSPNSGENSPEQQLLQPLAIDESPTEKILLNNAVNDSPE